MSGAEPLILAAALGGTALEYSGQQQAKRERRNILNQAFDEQRRTTEKSAQMLADEGAKYGGDRQQTFTDQEAAIYDQTQNDLIGAGGDIVGSGTGGNVSSDFIKAKADKAITEGNRLTAIAREAARLRAPGLATSNEKERQADLMSRTGSMWGRTKNMVNAGVMDAQSVQAPGYATLGSLAKQAAMIYALGGAGAGAAPASAGLDG